MSWFPKGQKSRVTPGLVPRYDSNNGNLFRPMKVDEVDNGNEEH